MVQSLAGMKPIFANSKV